MLERNRGWLLVASIVLAAAQADALSQNVSLTLVTGAPDMFMPGAQLADLDAGVVVGSTRWDNDHDGVFFNDTRVGFLWDASAGARVFAIPDTLYWIPNFHFPSAVSSNRVVVGTDIFRESLLTLPFRWTPTDGFSFLPTLCIIDRPGGLPGFRPGDCPGAAAAISADGRIIAGVVQASRTSPTQAARWLPTAPGSRLPARLEVLDADDAWSVAWSVSADGSVIVGGAGSAEESGAAARWVGGTRTALAATGLPSLARFTSRDGSAAIGWATEDGRRVLARWDAAGSVLLAAPPEGMSVETITAINPTASAAVGALSSNGNRAPFVWTLDDGFTVIPELGREQDYDLSEAFDVSDDGNAVIGTLQASVVSNGDPRSYAFLWTRSGGFVTINELAAAAGEKDPDYYTAGAISGDGRRIFATGNPPRTQFDTNSVIVTLGDAAR